MGARAAAWRAAGLTRTSAGPGEGAALRARRWLAAREASNGSSTDVPVSHRRLRFRGTLKRHSQDSMRSAVKLPGTGSAAS